MGLSELKGPHESSLSIAKKRAFSAFQNIVFIILVNVHTVFPGL